MEKYRKLQSRVDSVTCTSWTRGRRRRRSPSRWTTTSRPSPSAPTAARSTPTEVGWFNPGSSCWPAYLKVKMRFRGRRGLHMGREGARLHSPVRRWGQLEGNRNSWYIIVYDLYLKNIVNWIRLHKILSIWNWPLRSVARQPLRGRGIVVGRRQHLRASVATRRRIRHS